MKKKWIAVLMTATMAVTTISPAVYAEDMTENASEEVSEYNVEQPDAEIEEKMIRKRRQMI